MDRNHSKAAKYVKLQIIEFQEMRMGEFLVYCQVGFLHNKEFALVLWSTAVTNIHSKRTYKYNKS